MTRLITLAALALAAATPALAAPQPVKVTGAWCRAAPAGALAGGCYLTLTSPVADRLLSVETSAAARAEIHTMDMSGGVMRMRQLTGGVELPAGQAVELKPGARHLMVIGPKATLANGGVVPLTLKFAKARPVTITAPVRVAPAPVHD